MTDETFLEQFSSQYGWHVAPAKRRFRYRKEVNKGMRETHRLALTMKGVVDRALDDVEGLQASDYSTYQIFEGGDLAFKLIDLENIKTSRVGLVPRRGIMSPAYIRLTPAHHDADTRFYAWFFFAVYFNNIFNGMGGGVRQNLTPTDLLEFPIPLPDLATQRQIADFLDRETARIDLLIEKKQRLVTLLAEREEGTFIEHVTGKDLFYEKKNSGIEWIGEIPEHWFAPKFTQIARQETGHTPSRKDEGYWVPEECVIPWVSLADVWQIRGGQAIYISETSEKISEIGMANSSARLLPKNTVILSRTASVGFPAVMSKPMATTQDFAAWICGKRMRPLFLYYVLRSMKPVFRRLMMGSTHQTIYMPDIRSFRTPLPPLAEQDAIVSRLASTIQVFRQSSAALTESIDRLKEYRSALITAAVTGQIDVQTYAKSGTPDRRLDTIQEEMGA